MASDGRSSLAHAQLEGFSEEQIAYLGELIEQLDLIAVFSAPPADEGGGVPQSVYGTPLEDLCTQERLKLEQHPDEMWPKLRAHAAAAKMPEGGDTFMFKHHGLFNVQPAQAGFMCRLRIPACKLKAHQFAGLGDLADQLAGGYSHVTTRGNLQVREIQPQNIIDVLERLYDLGLTCKGSGADSVRNITCNPTAGFDPQELIDLSPYAVRLHHHILNTPSLHGIPRKFNIAFDGGGIISTVADTNDIGFVAYQVKEEYLAEHPELSEIAPDGIICRILLGGITGHSDFAISSGFACTPDQTLDVSLAILQVFIENADRTNRKKARLKYVLDAWGHEKFTLESESRLPFDLLRIPEDALVPRGPVARQAHIGIHPQSDPSLKYLGVSLTLGRMSGDQMRGLADVAARYGNGDIRLTVWQNVLIPNVPEANIEPAVAAIRALGFDVSASAFSAGMVACTGRFACQYASAHTKEHGHLAVQHLQERFQLDQPINIHLTGCTHSCAQHYIGDIGLLGASTEDGREAYQVYLGGGSDQDKGIARYLHGPVAADELNDFLAGIIATYLEARSEGESFLEFTRRHDELTLREMFLSPQAAELAQQAVPLANTDSMSDTPLTGITDSIQSR
ncbi:NirA family protein [bacterium]|nr:NirA family protein [bacterium]